jgi:hypothetical protein
VCAWTGDQVLSLFWVAGSGEAPSLWRQGFSVTTGRVIPQGNSPINLGGVGANSYPTRAELDGEGRVMLTIGTVVVNQAGTGLEPGVLLSTQAPGYTLVGTTVVGYRTDAFYETVRSFGTTTSASESGSTVLASRPLDLGAHDALPLASAGARVLAVGPTEAWLVDAVTGEEEIIATPFGWAPTTHADNGEGVLFDILERTPVEASLWGLPDSDAPLFTVETPVAGEIVYAVPVAQQAVIAARLPE